MCLRSRNDDLLIKILVQKKEKKLKSDPNNSIDRYHVTIGDKARELLRVSSRRGWRIVTETNVGSLRGSSRATMPFT